MKSKNDIFYAPTIDSFLFSLHDNETLYGQVSQKKMRELFTLLEQIQICGDDNRHELWLSASRGPIEAYGDYEDMLQEGCIANREEFEACWKSESGHFFACCALGYAACGYENKDLPAKMQYLAHADGRDDGLRDLPEDDPSAFETWYADRYRRGGHPWEVSRGGNSTHIDLFVSKDDGGYYFSVAGRAWNRCVEAVHFFLALKKAGIPVAIYDGDLLAHRFLGIDYVGIIPDGIFPRYCESLFPEAKVIDFMNLDNETAPKLLPYIHWHPLNAIALVAEMRDNNNGQEKGDQA